MLTLIELLILALAPSLFLMIYFYLKDKYEPEPLGLVVNTFLRGALFTIMAAIVEIILAGVIPKEPLIIYTVLGIGIPEEYFKYRASIKAFNSDEFDEPMDGIIYGVSASLGFATVENLLYVMLGGLEVGLLRALFSVPGHALFGAIMGVQLTHVKFAGSSRFTAVLYPGLVHGLYDFFVMEMGPSSLPLITTLLLLAYIYIRRRISEFLRASPFTEEYGG